MPSRPNVLPLLGCLLLVSGCSPASLAQRSQSAQPAASPPPQAPPEQGSPRPVAVEAASVAIGSLRVGREYTGTTQPWRSVVLRARTEGLLLNLAVDVGDPVQPDQVIGELDDALLQTALNQARSQLLALQAQVSQAEAQVSRAKAEVEQVRLEWQQALADAQRSQALAEAGALSAQQAEQDHLVALTAEQSLRTAQEEVRSQEQTVLAQQASVAAQQAVLAQAEERLSYTRLRSPLSGVVVERLSEPGNLLQTGQEILSLGDFSQVKVNVSLSELQLGEVQVGQSVQVSLDAFPGQSWQGRVNRISPAADPETRLVPVEVVMPNPQARLGSGLLARVEFAGAGSQQMVLPESALQSTGSDPQVFVVVGQGESTMVQVRSVEVGEVMDGKVEILSGLSAGESVVIRSASPLTDGQRVRLSLLSQPTQQEG
ncbi:MAG: efflux RND transporter periplasmic adaptor subunit [Cyanobacteriota bacterium]|nr:efflux RND transporter periplasmic adaptor subunit [Cyanobacteriota bacterium]